MVSVGGETVIGRVLNNRYRIDAKIGDGGMALVFSGEDQLLGRQVAIKVLRPQFANDQEFIRRFRREARSAASLNHSQIVNVFDIGEDQELHYLVMEYIKGRNLKEMILQQGRLPLKQGLHIVQEIGEALRAAHANNIVHCDIKPHNILVTPANGIKVTDFGIARAMSSVTITHTESVIGSAHYISPEQAKGEKVSPSTDIYSLGIVAYELFTGRQPFTGESPISIALKHIRDMPEPPSRHREDLPSYIEQIIMKALEKETEKRYASIEAMLLEIQSVKSLLSAEEEGSPESPTQVLDLPIKKKGFNQDKKSDAKALEDTRKATVEELSLEEDSPKATRRKPKKKKGSARRKKPKKNPLALLRSIQWKPAIKLPSFSGLGSWQYLYLSLIILLVLAVTGWFAYKVYMNVPIAIIPDVQGLAYEEARDTMAQTGFDVTIQGEQYHNDIPKGHVVSQFPRPEQEIRVSRRVGLILSSGAVWSEVPDLKGLTLREAEVILGAAGLIMGEKTYEHHDEMQKDFIIDQYPEPGGEIRTEEEVAIVLSKGSLVLQIEMPDLIGMDQDEAIRLLETLSLEAGQVMSEESTRFIAGQVSKQDPEPGEMLAEGSTIDLHVSSGILNPQGSPIYAPGIRIPVPAGPQEQEIRIVVVDDNGEQVVYEGVHSPGERVFQRVHTVGPTTVQIYIDGSMVKEEKIGF